MSLIPLGFWAASAAGGGGAAAYDLLETQILSSSASSVTFTGLDTLAAGYKHLQIRFAARAADAATGRGLYATLNSDSGSNYAWHRLAGNGSSVIALASVSSIGGSLLLASIPADSVTSSAFGAGVTEILDFASSSKNTTVRSLGGRADPSTNYVSLNSGVWLNTAAITSISLFANIGNLLTGSRFSLYGLKG